MTNPYRIIGYCDRPSVRPGELLRFMVSTTARHYTARLARLGRSRELHVPVASTLEGQHEGQLRALKLGSHIDFDAEIPLPDAPVLSAWIRATRPTRGEDQGQVP